MIKIKKVGTNDYGKWVCFEFLTDIMTISGIAKTDLDLEESKSYNNLCLVQSQKNGKIFYKIVVKNK